jgi:hypothetical protein
MAMLDLSISQELEMLEDRWSHVGPKYLFQRRMRLDEGFGGPEKPR